jgi:hypothetical protein
MAGYNNPGTMGQIEQAQLVKWVIVPGATLTALIVLKRVLTRKK